MSDNIKKPVGIFIPNIHQSGMNKYLKLICDTLSERGFKAFLFSSYSDFYKMDKNAEGEFGAMSLGMKTPLSAMIIYGELIKNDKVISDIAECGLRQGIPVFTIDYHYEGAVNIRYGYGESFRQIVDHVIEVHGAKNLVLISGIRNNSFSVERNEAFERSLKNHGLEFSEDLIYYGGFWSEPAAEALGQLLKDRAGNIPDAIICANDMMAIAVCVELEKRGIHVPNDIIVTGFDGVERALMNYPSITTAEPDYVSAGRFIADTVEAAVNGNPPEPQTKIFGFSVIYGQSCGCRKSSNVAAGIVNAELNDRIAAEQVFRMSMDHMVLRNVDGRGLISALEASGQYAGYVTYRGIEIYLDPTLFASPRGMTCHKVLAARTLPDSSDYSVPFTEAAPDKLCSDVMYNASDTFVFLPIHRQDIIYGYAAAQCSVENVHVGERLYDFITHMNMMLSSIEATTKLSDSIVKLDNMYIRDPLTDLLNRRGFRRELPPLIAGANAENRIIALISADMDGLKFINDTYGHSEGDFAIASLANILVDLTGHRGICARFGGDEYMAAVTVDPESIPDYGTRLTELLTAFNNRSGKPYRIHASIGVELTEPAELGSSLEEIMKRADDKMYRQKKLSKMSRGFRIKPANNE